VRSAPGIAYGLVAPLFEQAKVAANHLAQFGIGFIWAR
jgi:nitrite reductase (NADH) large subunit